MNKNPRRLLHILKYVKCWLHQPFVKMIKSPRFHGYICPKCENKMGELWREYQLAKLLTKR